MGVLEDKIIVEIRLKYLVDIYISLASLSYAADSARLKANLEQIILDVQLFGNDSQIAKAKEIVDNLVDRGQLEFRDLMREVRNEVRSALSLSNRDDDVIFVKFNKQ